MPPTLDLATLIPLLLAALGAAGTIIAILANAAKIHEWWSGTRLRRSKREPTKCEFLNFSLALKITDPASKMVHHTMSLRIKNISKKPLGQHSLYLFGDVARSWEDLHLRLYSEDGTPIDIKERNLDSPYRKEFTIKLEPPLYRDEDRLYVVEWDWDEPDRYFEYAFAIHCKSAQVELVFPVNRNYGLSVYELSRETREKKVSDVKPQKMRIIGNEARIAWARDEIGLNTILRLEWRELGRTVPEELRV